MPIAIKVVEIEPCFTAVLTPICDDKSMLIDGNNLWLCGG